MSCWNGPQWSGTGGELGDLAPPVYEDLTPQGGTAGTAQAESTMLKCRPSGALYTLTHSEVTADAQVQVTISNDNAARVVAYEPSAGQILIHMSGTLAVAGFLAVWITRF